MADFRQQLLALLSANGGNSLIQTESTVNERIIPTENGANIVIQQRKEVEREVKIDCAHVIENSIFPPFSLRRVRSFAHTTPFAMPIKMLYDIAAPGDCIL